MLSRTFYHKSGEVTAVFYNSAWEWFRSWFVQTAHGSVHLSKGSSNMGKASEIKKKIAALEAELESATRLPAAAELKTGDVFENAEGQGRILIQDGVYFRLVGAKKGQVLRPVFSTREAVLAHMEENDYSKRA